MKRKVIPFLILTTFSSVYSQVENEPNDSPIDSGVQIIEFETTISGFDESGGDTDFWNLKDGISGDIQANWEGSNNVNLREYSSSSRNELTALFGLSNFDSPTLLNENSFYSIEITGFNAAYSVNLSGTALGENPTLSNFNHDLQNEKIDIVNPIYDKIKLSSNNTTIDEVSIFNLSGALVSESLNISDLSNGIYLIRLQTKYGILTKKIVKE